MDGVNRAGGRTYFSICCYEVRSQRPKRGPSVVQAIVEVRLARGCVRRSATGVGPVHALDRALRSCLEEEFPELASVRLSDYNVSVLDASVATAAQVRVTIEATDGYDTWAAERVSENIVDASFDALCATAVTGIDRLRDLARDSA